MTRREAAAGAPGGARRRRSRAWWWAAYLVALGASFLVRHARTAPGAPPEYRFVDVPAVRSDVLTGGTMRLAYLRWGPAGGERGLPVIALHGSPGSARDFAALGPMLSADGREVISVEQPGFGYSTEGVSDRSMRGAAHAVLGLMDAMGMERAHLVGWSNGGGTALNIADIAPERAASVTMLASIGAQETEGSGSYWFEHFKYAVGYALATAARELLPHFGLLDGLSFIQSSMRNFWESDQRPLRTIMERMTTPVLILHGREDFLTPAWAAEEHHRLLPRSHLVILDASHFIPLLQADEAALHLTQFSREVEAGGEFEGEAFYLEDPPYRHPLGEWGERMDASVRSAPWWAVLACLAALTVVSPLIAASVAAHFVARNQCDPALAMAGLALGLMGEAALMWWIGQRRGAPAAAWPIVRRRVGHEAGFSAVDWSRRLERRCFGLGSAFSPWRRAEGPFAAGVLRVGSARMGLGVSVGAVLWGVVMVIAGTAAWVAAMRGVRQFEPGWAAGGAAIAALILVRFFLSVAQHLLTWGGRRRIGAALARALRREFWPAWVFYLPLVPFITAINLRRWGPMDFSCANPGIEGGGGIIGESKARIMADLSHAGGRALETHLIAAGPSASERAAMVARLLEARPGLRGCGVDGFPLILKPDGGQRGHAVRLARSQRDVAEYFERMTAAAVVQKFDPGPRECGVFWVRKGAANIEPRAGAESGSIFSITRKEFPVVTGDGRRTLEEIVFGHRRLRCQARVFLARFAHERSRVLGAGEVLRLAQAGNHCQGTMFLDGADLVTPALSAAIDGIARGFPRGEGGGLDFGRFDLRYESDELLRQGKGFSIVELNGTTSESTNLYDPNKSVIWAYGVLFAQWATLYRLGHDRRLGGARPLELGQMLQSIRAFYRDRPGSNISD